MSLLGLDIGTSGCKAVIFDLEGNILSRAYREYPLLYPREGWIELDPKLLLNKIEESIKEATQVSKVKKDPVEAISISCQGEAFVPVDKQGNPLTNIPVSFDTRGKEFSQWWEERLGEEKVMSITGMPINSMFSLNKIMWFKKKYPEVYKKTWKFLCLEDFLIYKWGFPPTIDYSLASRTMAFNILEKKWSDEILSIAGLNKSLLPKTVPSGTSLGEIPSDIASRLSLPTGVIMVTGGHDQPCGALGAGVKEEGIAMDATGTVECIASVFKKPHLHQKMWVNNFACYPYVDSSLYITLAFNFSGGILLRWFRDTLGSEEREKAKREKKDVYSLLIEEAREEPSSLYLLPHFTTTGTPYMDAGSTGVILGLSLNTTKNELIKAILEGISLEMKQNLNLLEEAGIPVYELRAIGGGAKSKKWLQLKANIYKKKIVSLKVSEAACLGAALLAGVGKGKYNSLDEAIKETVKIKESFYPQKEETKIYEEKYQIYKDIYPTLKDLNQRIKNFSSRNY